MPYTRRVLRPALAACSAMVALVMSYPVVPLSHADSLAYLVNVHVRPGYNFPNADAALAYGQSVCDRVSGGMGYGQLVNQVGADVGSDDYFQAGYLINQAVNELCPAQIWQLRQSAAGYSGRG